MKWHEYYFEMCRVIASKSKDTSTTVGCVIVGPDHEIRSTGYNDFPRGVKDYIVPMLGTPGDGLMTDEQKEIASRRERPLKYKWTEHAERNAIYNAARCGIALKGCSLYCMSYPIPFFSCSDCARAIIQSGIIEVHFNFDPKKIPDRWKEDNDIAKEMMIESGVIVTNHFLSPCIN